MIYLFQDLVKDLYDTFGTPATLLDVNDRVLAFSEQPPGLADPFRRDALLMMPVDAELEKAVVRHVNDVARTVTDVTRIPAAPQLGLFERVVIPLLANGVASAYVYLIDPQRKVSDEQLQPFAALFSDVARHVELERMSRWRLPAAVAGIVSGDERERRIAVETIEGLGVVRVAPPMCAAVVASRLPIDGMSNTIWRRIFGSSSIWSFDSGRAVGILSKCGPVELERMRSELDSVSDHAHEIALAAAIGSSVAELADVHISYRHALRGLRLASSAATESSVAVWDELGPWRTVLSMSEDEATASIDPRVRRLLASETPATVSMLRQHLEREADAQAIAAGHHIHRTTLYATLRRLQEKHGLRWDRTDDRLAAVLGIRIERLYGDGQPTLEDDPSAVAPV